MSLSTKSTAGSFRSAFRAFGLIWAEKPDKHSTKTFVIFISDGGKADFITLILSLTDTGRSSIEEYTTMKSSAGSPGKSDWTHE
jgi:hypothetical protein